MRAFIKYNWPSILWAAFILYLSLAPGSGLPKVKIPHFDKVVHVGFYLVLVLLLAWGWRKQPSYPVLYHNPYLKIFIIAASYGLFIEAMQSVFTLDRQFEWLDEMANSIGAGIGCLLAVKIFK